MAARKKKAAKARKPAKKKRASKTRRRKVATKGKKRRPAKKTVRRKTRRKKAAKKKLKRRKTKPRLSKWDGDKILAERLISVREEQGLTRVTVCEETGISYESLSGYELCDEHPPFWRVRRLAIYYGVSLDYFAGRTDRQ
ncbi:MAG: helix-turn-helix domain-containing protein [Planctomycetota bacterium]|jgi:hypothetical protein